MRNYSGHLDTKNPMRIGFFTRRPDAKVIFVKSILSERKQKSKPSKKKFGHRVKFIASSRNKFCIEVT